MFVQHQKATAHWLCSIWPNMEGKNAAFSRNQTRKRKKKEGFLACCVHSEIELSHSLLSGHRTGSLSKQHDWWWCRTCRDISANTHTNTNMHTCTTRESWKRGTPIFSLHWHLVLNTHKSFLHFHIWALYRSLNSALCVGAPWKGTFLLVKKQPSQTPQSSAQVRNGLFIWPPLLYGGALTFSCHCCKNVCAGTLSSYLGHCLGSMCAARLGCKCWKSWEQIKKGACASVFA